MLQTQKLIVVATIIVTILAPTIAVAQSVCSERTKFVDQLSTSYAERTIGLGLVNNGSVLEILVSKNGTWTILITKPDGISCVVATGEAWEEIPAAPASEPKA